MTHPLATADAAAATLAEPSLPSPSPALPSPPTSLSLGRSLPSSSLPPALAAATLHRWSVALAVATQTAPNESATPLAATLAATIVAPAVIAAAIAVDRCPVVMSGRNVRSYSTVNMKS